MAMRVEALDAEAEIEEAWAEEVERRHALIESGEARMMPGPETLAAIRAKKDTRK